ncbi:hypothetical protein RhiirC2_845282 [Rhizophagus irregularis]|uniref:Uncharacterized protein n=1 Tax=Rhizophagus irregularis TaxID=588596 RepID=A0A2N1NR21_9GLOM|nr:hypothetical protein RhiirC2_845282 [Rhizophagus irregularis]
MRMIEYIEPQCIRTIFALCRRICGGYREEPIEGTLLEYSQLYQKCWVEIRLSLVESKSQPNNLTEYLMMNLSQNDMMVVIIINNNDDGSADGDDDGDGHGDRDRSSGAKGKTDIKFSL